VGFGIADWPDAMIDVKRTCENWRVCTCWMPRFRVHIRLAEEPDRERPQLVFNTRMGSAQSDLGFTYRATARGAVHI